MGSLPEGSFARTPAERYSARVEQIGPYRILGEAGRGGMGVVYHARGPAGEDVALKLLLAHRAADPQVRRRFQVEVQALARLRHPGVVSILDAGEQRGIPWLALDYVEGQSLGARLAQGPLPVWEAIRICEQLAHALGYIHGCGVLHRDLKPDNVLLRGAQALLTDFGLARDSVGSQASLTATGVFLGTPGYWAPEQARGERGEVGVHTDVYGLGAVLYACLTGRPPVAATSLHAHLDALEAPIRPPHSLRGSVPRWLSDLCMRCLAQAPQQRPASAEEVARALCAPDAGASPRRPALPLVGGLAAIALALGGGVVWLALDPEPATESPPTATRPAPPPAPPAASPRERAQALATRGHGLLDDHQGSADRVRGARDAFAQALRLDPDCALALAGLGQLASLAGDTRGALSRYEEALRLDPDCVPALRGRAAQLGEREQHEAALRDLDRVLELDPDDSLASYNRGITRMHLGNAREAIADFDRAERQRPNETRIFAERGSAKLQLGRIEDALRDLDRARELGPNDASVAYTRGLAFAMLGRHQEAVDELGRALQLGADDHQTWAMRGSSLAALGRYPEALEEFDRAIFQAPGQAEHYAMRARCHAALGDTERALADYDRALELDSQDARTLATRGTLLARLGRVAAAERDLDRAVELLPGMAEIRVNRGTFLSTQGRLEDALRDFDAAVRAEPNHPVVLAKRAYALHDLGRREAALRDIDRALQQDTPPGLATKLRQLRTEVSGAR